MTTIIGLNDKLIKQAMILGSHKSKNEAATAALKEYITHRKQLNIINLFGKIEFIKGFDNKVIRNR